MLIAGVDDCCDIDKNMLIGIYDRVKANEFKTGSDHVTQVLKVQSTIVGKKPVSVLFQKYLCNPLSSISRWQRSFK